MTKTLAEPKAAASKGAVRFSAMSILAMREHSKHELQQKLSRRFEDAALVSAVIQQLSDENLQSDERFAEAFIAMRMRKGQGPVRIANDLRQRGVDADTLTKYLDVIDSDKWCEIAEEVCFRKYREPSDELQLKAKQMRFLQYRGFTSDQIRMVWKMR